MLATLLSALAGACTFDPDDRCGPHQTLYGDDDRCVCDEGYALLGNVCVACGEHEQPGASGCDCVDGYTRATPNDACEKAEADLGAACDDDDGCASDQFSHCQLGEQGGYCTSLDCASSGDCADGYACDTTTTPSFCRRPPVGQGRACDTAPDCADGEPTYCESFQSHICLVEDCTVTPNDCFEGWTCTDLTSLGLAKNLCIPEGSL